MPDSNNQNKVPFFKKLSYMDYIFIGVGILLISVFVGGFLLGNSSDSDEKAEVAGDSENTQVRLYEFWGNTCPHCKKANEFLEEYVPTVEGLAWQKYEVYGDKENNKLFEEVTAELDAENVGVPFIIIGDEMINGFGEGTDEVIKNRVNYCLENDCPDSVAKIVGLAEVSSTQTVSTKDFNEGWQRDKTAATLLDLRTPEEYQADHLANSKMVDFYDPNFQSELEKLDRNQTYYIYCNSGNRSGEALEMMENMGFQTVYDLDGGIQAWMSAGLPVTS